MEKTTLKQGDDFCVGIEVIENDMIRIVCGDAFSMLLTSENADRFARKLDATREWIEARRQLKLPHREVLAIAVEGNPLKSNKGGVE